eukprot:5916085-Amphidinium_carterae.1
MAQLLIVVKRFKCSNTRTLTSANNEDRRHCIVGVSQSGVLSSGGAASVSPPNNVFAIAPYGKTCFWDVPTLQPFPE